MYSWRQTDFHPSRLLTPLTSFSLLRNEGRDKEKKKWSNMERTTLKWSWKSKALVCNLLHFSCNPTGRHNFQISCGAFPIFRFLRGFAKNGSEPIPKSCWCSWCWAMMLHSYLETVLAKSRPALLMFNTCMQACLHARMYLVVHMHTHTLPPPPSPPSNMKGKGLKQKWVRHSRGTFCCKTRARLFCRIVVSAGAANLESQLV